MVNIMWNSINKFSKYVAGFLILCASLLLLGFSFSKESAFSGEKGLTIKSQNEEFSVKPLLTYEDEKKEVSFNDVETNYSNYGIISFYVKNNCGNYD